MVFKKVHADYMQVIGFENGSAVKMRVFILYQ